MRNKRFMKVVSTSLLISMLACSTVFGAEINAGTGFAGALPAESYEMENDVVESLTSEQVKIKSEKKSWMFQRLLSHQRLELLHGII